MNEYCILIKGCNQIEQLVEEVEKIFELRFNKRLDAERDLYETRIAGSEISIYTNYNFVNNLGIEFTKYPLIIDFIGLANIYTDLYFDDFLRLFPLVIANNLSRKFGYRCLVIRNLSTIIASIGNSGTGD